MVPLVYLTPARVSRDYLFTRDHPYWTSVGLVDTVANNQQASHSIIIDTVFETLRASFSSRD
jgi:hypothetical protein